MKRIIKPTKIQYKQDNEEQDKDRSRQKKITQKNIVKVDINRRSKFLAAKRQRQQQQQLFNNPNIQNQAIKIIGKEQGKVIFQSHQNNQKQKINIQKQGQKDLPKIEKDSSQEDGQQDLQPKNVLLKPVFIDKSQREDLLSEKNQTNNLKSQQIKLKQQERKRKAITHTTKLLLSDNIKESDEEQQGNKQSDDDLNQTKMPSDDDHANQRYQYQLWKIRQLKRIRRDNQQRQRDVVEKAQLERRRKMNTQQILLENKRLGSDLTDHNSQVKYVYMQKYYHKGAFYQDSNDPVYQRDYNLPTPLQMQDKTLLPQILQKRKGQFGMKGQSKYTHLTNEDTTQLDPLLRPDQSILDSWKKKTGGYKNKSGK